MSLQTHTKHALRMGLGEQAGGEVIRLLDRLSDELKAEEANAKAKAAKIVAALTAPLDTAAIIDKVTAGAVALNAALTPAPPVVEAVAPPPPVIAPAPAAPAAEDDSAAHDAPV